MPFSMADSDASDEEHWESDKEEAESPKVNVSCWSVRRGSAWRGR